MVAQDRHEYLRWMAPHPMWLNTSPGLNGEARRPAILRFASEDFMEELAALTATRPEALPAWLAVPETWREPAPTPPKEGLVTAAPLSATRARATALARKKGLVGGAAAKPVPQVQADLKLYQPAQNRFYMVAAQLVCPRPGLPDRTISSAREERPRFVLRQLVQKVASEGEFDPEGKDANGLDEVDEYAFIPHGEDGGHWRLLAPEERGRLIPDEERHGLFPTTYSTDGRKRRLLLGALPIARRETYIGSTRSNESPDLEITLDESPQDPVALLWHAEVTAPWTVLIDQAAILQEQIADRPGEPNMGTTSDGHAERFAAAEKLLFDYRAGVVQIGWLILADARRFLQTHLPVLWDDLQGLPTPRSLTGPETMVKGLLQSITIHHLLVGEIGTDHSGYPGQVKAGFVEALLALSDDDVLELEKAPKPFDWENPPSRPAFLWIPAHPPVNPASTTGTNTWDSWPSRAGASSETVAELQALIEVALVENAATEGRAGPVPDLRPPRDVNRREDAWFTVRCVFERPNCVGFAAPVVSAPTAPFQMASFFDPDAPARDIRIPMPIDLSPAGLRKFRKSAGFAVSDMFCGETNRFKKVTLGDLIRSVLPWPLHKDLPSADSTACKTDGGSAFGLMISLSIPIVTICAFILMMIMVTLLDMIFKWLPYLMTVIPIRLRKGAKE